MCTFAHAAESIERWDAERGGKVAVRTSSGGRFLQAHAEFLGTSARFLKQSADGRRPLHGGTIQSAFHVQGTAFVDGTQRSKLLVERRGILQFRDANVYVDVRLRRNHVGARTARDYAWVYGNPLLEVGERRDFRDLARQLKHCAGAGLKVDACVRRLSLHADGVIADAFARGLELAFESSSRLDD